MGRDAPVDGEPPITSRQDLAQFVRGLARQIDQRPDAWENNDLPSFLEAMAARIDDMDGAYRNGGRPMPAQPSWGVIAEMLEAATAYESPRDPDKRSS